MGMEGREGTIEARLDGRSFFASSSSSRINHEIMTFYLLVLTFRSTRLCVRVRMR